MRNSKLANVRNSFFLLIGQVALLVLAVVFIVYMYTYIINPDRKVAEDFTIATCHVLDKGMATTGRVVRRYRADFKVQYNALKGPVVAIASTNGMDFSYSTSAVQQQQFLDEFDVGAVVPCWYDPENPNIVVLVLRHNWLGEVPLVFPALIILFMAFYIIKSVADLLEVYLAARQRQKK